MSKKEEQRETAADRAMMEMSRNQMMRWKAVHLPNLKAFAAKSEAAMAPDSYERRHATSMAATDVDAKFAGVQQAVDAGAAAGGNLGSAKHKLAQVGVAADQATSGGLSAVSADQAVDTGAVQNLGAVVSLAKGDAAQTMDAAGQQARIAAAQAASDAERSYNNRAGNAGLAAKIIGTGAGLWMSGAGGGIGETNDIAGVNGSNATDKFLRYGTSGD